MVRIRPNGDIPGQDVIELLAKILIEGRGGGIVNPLDPQFGIGGDAITSRTRRTRRGPTNVSGRAARVTLPGSKKKRKVSRYQKRFGVHLKALKKKHPRTNISTLMSKAHRLTRRDMK